MSQNALANALGTTQPAVSGWVRGESEPAAELVFRLERELDLPPGHLSRTLGYLPPEAVTAPPATFEAVVTDDPLLDETQKRGLLAMYREFTARSGRRNGRPPN